MPIEAPPKKEFAKARKKDPILPSLRLDLKLQRGPDNADGSPTYSLYDPLVPRYYHIGWKEALILESWKQGMTLSQLIHSINSKSTLAITEEELGYFIEDAKKNNLLNLRHTSEKLSAVAIEKKVNPFTWLIYHYLYFRIPLINPDAFLAKTLPYVKTIFFSKVAKLIYGIIFVAGILQLLTQFDEYLKTFTYFFNLEGFIFYALAITLVKVIHEFSHAYVAKNYGVHVPSMGITFIVLWPVLYTDVTDAWKLQKRSQRLAISFAGIGAELIVAGICTLGWSLTKPGMLQSAFFIISTVTWLSTLSVNLNPAMRFDGYYILSDLWGIDNLQYRAFAVTRWKIREWLLGIKMPPPEESLTSKRITGMVAYSMITWSYRFGLYTTIAVLIYLESTKILGIFLFGIEIGIFIIWPLVSEVQFLHKLWAHLKLNPRLIATGSLFALLTLWFVIPLPHKEHFPAITIPNKNQVIFSPYDGVITKIYVKQDDVVKEGQVLMEIISIPLQIEISKLDLEKQTIEQEILLASVSDKEKVYLPEKKAKLSEVEAKLSTIKELHDRLTIKALISGEVYAWENDLKVGQSVSKDEAIGKIANLKEVNVISFIQEDYIYKLKPEMEVKFKIRGSSDVYNGKIIRLNPYRENVLVYPQLASLHKGDLPVSQEGGNGKMLLIESYYVIQVALDKTKLSLPFGKTGYVEVDGIWSSKFMDMIHYIESVFWRESAF